MARIRTIKPDFFRHEGLFEAERETGLPLRVAFAGIWCAADREGRFRWKPNQLKLDVLPYDSVDFSRVLDALRTRGFIVAYGPEQSLLGYIPSWKVHQFINNREAASTLPEPPALITQFDASRTRDERVKVITKWKGKGKGKGKGKKEPSQEEHNSRRTVVGGQNNSADGVLSDEHPFGLPVRVIDGGRS